MLLDIFASPSSDRKSYIQNGGSSHCASSPREIGRFERLGVWSPWAAMAFQVVDWAAKELAGDLMWMAAVISSLVAGADGAPWSVAGSRVSHAFWPASCIAAKAG